MLTVSLLPKSLLTVSLLQNRIRRFPGHPESVDALAVFDDDTLITGSFDGVVGVRDLF